MVKNLPAMQETWVQSVGWEDPLEEGMATYSSSPWTEELGGLQSTLWDPMDCSPPIFNVCFLSYLPQKYFSIKILSRNGMINL